VKGIFTSSEDDEVVSEEVIILEQTSRSGRILQLLELSLRSLAVIELEVVASLQVNSDDRIWVESEVDGQNLQGNIIVVHLVVAERDIDVNGVEVLVLDEKLFIDFSGLLKVRSQIVERSHAELILNRVGQPSVQGHDVVLVAQLLRKLEK